MKRLLVTMTLAALLLLVSAGCNAQDAIPAVSDTPSPAPQTIRPTSPVQPSETVIPTETRVPPTVTPTVILTPTPAGPLSEEGPWIMLYTWSSSATYPGGPHLFAMNADSTGFRILEDDEVLDYAIQPPDRSMIAYIARENSDSIPELRVVQLPEGTIKTLTPLTTEAIAPQIDKGMLHAAIFGGGLSWSPDGMKIAFIGALDDPSIDVYVFDISTERFTRVADLENYQQIYAGEYDIEFGDETRHATNLSWSPDGRYVRFLDFTELNMEAPWTSWSSYWAASPDGSRSLLLMKPWDGGGRPNSFGWQDGATLLLSQLIGAGLPIIAVNLDTGTVKSILEEELKYAAYAPKHNTWLLLPWPDTQETRDMLQILRPDGTRIDLPNVTVLYISYRWSENEDAFWVPGEEVDYRVTVDGLVTEVAHINFPFESYPGEHYVSAKVSPDQTLAVWVSDSSEYFSGVWVGKPDTEPEAIHFVYSNGEAWEDDDNLIVEDAFWSPDSQELILLTHQGVYLARRPGFELIQISSGAFYAYPYYSGTVEWLP